MARFSPKPTNTDAECLRSILEKALAPHTRNTRLPPLRGTVFAHDAHWLFGFHIDVLVAQFSVPSQQTLHPSRISAPRLKIRGAGWTSRAWNQKLEDLPWLSSTLPCSWRTEANTTVTNLRLIELVSSVDELSSTRFLLGAANGSGP